MCEAINFGIYFQILSLTPELKMPFDTCRYEQRKLNEVMDQVIVLSYMVDELREEVNAIKMSSFVAGNDNLMSMSPIPWKSDKKKKCHPLKKLKMYLKQKKASKVSSPDGITYRAGHNRYSNAPLSLLDASENAGSSTYPAASTYFPRARDTTRELHDKWEPAQNPYVTDSYGEQRRNDPSEDSRLLQSSTIDRTEEVEPVTRTTSLSKKKKRWKRKSVRVPVASNETFDVSYSDLRYPSFSENLETDSYTNEGRSMKRNERVEQQFVVDARADPSRSARSFDSTQTFARDKRNLVPVEGTKSSGKSSLYRNSIKEPMSHERSVTFLEQENIPKNTIERLQTSSASIMSNDSVEPTIIVPMVTYDEEVDPVSAKRNKTAVDAPSQGPMTKQDFGSCWTRKPKSEDNRRKFNAGNNKNWTCPQKCNSYAQAVRDKVEPVIETDGKITGKSNRMGPAKTTGTNTNVGSMSAEHKRTQTLREMDLKEQTMFDREELETKRKDAIAKGKIKATKDFYSQSEYPSSESIVPRISSENNSQSSICKDLKFNVVDRSELDSDQSSPSSSNSSTESPEEWSFENQNVRKTAGLVDPRRESPAGWRRKEMNDVSSTMPKERLPTFLQRSQNVPDRAFERLRREKKPKTSARRSVIATSSSLISVSDALLSDNSMIFDQEMDNEKRKKFQGETNCSYSHYFYPEEPSDGDMSISERKRALFRYVASYIFPRKSSQYIDRQSARISHQFASTSGQLFGGNAEYSAIKMLVIAEYRSRLLIDSELQMGDVSDKLYACLRKIDNITTERNRTL